MLTRPLPQAVSSLMAEMGAVLELHSSPAVLEAAARTYLSLCGEETAGCSTARAARDSLVQHWVEQLTALLGDSPEVRGTVRLYEYALPDMMTCFLFLCCRVTVCSLMRRKLEKSYPH